MAARKKEKKKMASQGQLEREKGQRRKVRKKEVKKTKKTQAPVRWITNTYHLHTQIILLELEMWKTLDENGPFYTSFFNM